MVSSGVWPGLVSGVSALGVLVTLSLPPSATSHAQPLPNCVAPAALNCFLNSSSEPKSRSIASFSSPLGAPARGSAGHGARRALARSLAASYGKMARV